MLRKRGTGVTAALILMFSITLFISSIFYLVYYNPLTLGMEPPEKIVTVTDNVETPEPVIYENITLQEAINELKQEGCTILSVKAPAYLSNPQYLNFDDFKLKTKEKKFVIMSPSDLGIFLLIQSDDTQWVWIP